MAIAIPDINNKIKIIAGTKRLFISICPMLSYFL